MKAFKSKYEVDLIKSTPGVCAAPLNGILKSSNSPSVQKTVSFNNKVVTQNSMLEQYVRPPIFQHVR